MTPLSQPNANRNDSLRRLDLTTLGSAYVDIEVTPAALPEAEGGATLWIRHRRGTPLEERTAYALTADEATQLVAAIADVIAPDVLRLPDPIDPGRSHS